MKVDRAEMRPQRFNVEITNLPLLRLGLVKHPGAQVDGGRQTWAC